MNTNPVDLFGLAVAYITFFLYIYIFEIWGRKVVADKLVKIDRRHTTPQVIALIKRIVYTDNIGRKVCLGLNKSELQIICCQQSKRCYKFEETYYTFLSTMAQRGE